MRKVADLHKKWGRDPEYGKAYVQLGPEFEFSRSLIEVRRRAKLTQAELAERMNTTQSVVARLKSGRTRTSTRTLEKNMSRQPGSVRGSALIPTDCRAYGAHEA